jgi:hypothetical protein
LEKGDETSFTLFSSTSSFWGINVLELGVDNNKYLTCQDGIFLKEKAIAKTFS